MKRECANTTHKHIIPWYLSWKVVITVWVQCIRFTQVEAKGVLQKVKLSFCESGFLSHQAHDIHPRREWVSLDDLCLWIPVGKPALIDLDLPLTALIGIARRRRKKIITYTQTRYKKSKTWATTLSMTYLSWPEGHKTRHTKASKVERTQAYLPLLLITFKHDY
jgi:hypothetical protein